MIGLFSVSRHWLLAVALILSGAGGAMAQTPAAQAPAADDECKDGGVLPVRPKTDLRSVRVTGICYLAIGRESFFKDINILRNGELRIIESNGGRNTKTDLWANSIIIENGGSLIANGGAVYYPNVIGPYGYGGGTLTIHLYGKDAAKWNTATRKYDSQNKGAVCKSDTEGRCGIPAEIWTSNGDSPQTMPGLDKDRRPIRDYFYQYGALTGDGDCTNNPANGKCEIGYFGTKVLAVSFGGTLDLYGFKGSIPPGWEGTSPPGPDEDPLSTGRSWRRLVDGQSLKPTDKTLYIEKATMVGDPALRWSVGDEIVVTTTDYLPGHSEKLQITEVADHPLGMRIVFDAIDNTDYTTGLLWHHNGTRYGGPKDSSGPPNDPGRNQWTNRLPGRLKDSIDPALRDNGAETRAAVALLTRSIQIVSAGDNAGDEFPKPETTPGKASYSFGGHMVIRQGFETVRIKGVEFRQLGQGGRIGHYPVHFHMARKTPHGTHVKDSSINESMTRWIVLHSTHGVTVARNVGYKSIGHGFYLEDGTETDNRFWSNIGIYARAAVATVEVDATDTTKSRVVANPQNPRMIPGILSDNQDPKDPKFTAPNVANPAFPYRSDSAHPTVFWITNGWNEFIGNMAAGAGTCGAAYWLVPASNMNMVDVPDPVRNKGVMTWSGYAELQGRPGFGGATPVKSFYKNYATSTMHSLQTTDDAPPCDGIIAADAKPSDTFRVMKALPSEAPWPERKEVYDEKTKKTINIPDNDKDHFYPHVLGGARMATECVPSGDGYDCSPEKVPSKCGTGPDPAKGPMQHCAAVVIDHFTSSFHWAHGNVSAIWLRPQWYLLTNSVITDVQNGGLSFVTGGDYTHSSMINGYWGLVRNTVFVGNTNNYPDAAKNNPFASNIGPFNAASKTGCDLIPQKASDNYCLNSAAGISMPVGGLFTNQRLLNIYDGPFYQDSNAYLDITTADCAFKGVASTCMYGLGTATLLLRKVPGTEDPNACYLPNAAIGWKQPNGFFYPPAFHSRNLFFDNVDLRHYVIAPSFEPNTYRTDEAEVKKQYCNGPPTMFDNFTAIDRQTELNDDDGTLTGLSNTADGHVKQTISINEDPFFSAPVEAPECGSSLGANTYSANACKAADTKLPPVTARTSPYDYVTTVVYHKATDDRDQWGEDCTNERCYGVPLFRQYLTDATGDKDPAKSEMKAWKDAGCEKQEIGKPPMPACRWPFIRMAGAAISQRNTLTINNGTYYLDTTVSADTQLNKDKYAKNPPVSLNVFAPGKQYHVFFVYAKQTTKQTYQIYVGPGFDKDKHFELTNVNVETKAFSFLPKVAKTQWAKATKYENGLLTVEVDFAGLTTLDPTPDNGLCAPRSFCKVDSNKMCVSNLNAGDRLFKESDAVCRTWAVKDLDCPPLVYETKNDVATWVRGGCPGFSFTLQSTVANDLNQRPQPSAYPTAGGSKPDWATKFSLPSDINRTGDRTGHCTYKDPLPDRSCPKKP